MADFTVLKMQVNTGASDAAPTWTDVLFATANYELRLCGTGAGAGNIASANWPSFLRPGSVGVIPEMWAYLGTDNSGGLKVTTYDGTSAHYMQFRVSWDNLGNFASQPLISCWKDTTLPAASPGTQPSPTVGGDGSSFVNGQVTDTGNLSYVHANAFGYGVDTGGVQQTPAANAAGTLAANSHSGAGAANPGTGAWLATWQDLQALTNYIQDAVIPKTLTAGFWYFVLAFFTGPNMTGGTLLPQLGFQYSWT